MTQYEFTDQYQREQADFYIDEPWCSEKLFEKIKFNGWIHDPACGSGTIVRSSWNAGYITSYADIINRGFANTMIENYLYSDKIWDNIITNPPYNLEEEFIYHALSHTKYKIAVIARLAFLAGQRRYHKLYSRTPPTLAIVFARRPSMPPLGVPVGGGKTDYCWLVWDKENESRTTTLDWII